MRWMMLPGSMAALVLALTPAGANCAQEREGRAQSAPASEPRAVAERVAALLQDEYLDAETGKAYAARMREQAAKGVYDGLTGAALAEKLTIDLLAVKDDAHLRVRLGAPAMRRMPGPASAGAGAKGPPTLEQQGWIAPGIAYVRLNEFPQDPVATEAVRAFLREHRSAKSLIVDLRTNHGGAPDLLDTMFPMLFSTPTRLFASQVRGGMEAVALAGPNLRRVKGGPDNMREYWVQPGPSSPMQKARIFVLTSPATASAAEVFAAAIKWSGRGTLIGARTAGANHMGALEMLDGGLTLFTPVGRVFSPADGKDWEGVGVEPHVDVPPEQALTAALIRAGLTEATAVSLADHYRPTLPMTRRPRPGQI
ncbi:MAG TPA: S41 family peptidase [Phenylobacterium sp.]|nr:S41 family peptidase [Phenylobacterium sp.]